MKYYIVKNTEGVQGHWGAFDTQEEAEAQSFTFDTVIIQSDKTPERILFEKQSNGTWLDIEREKTSQDFEREYVPRAQRGRKIVDSVRVARLKEVEVGNITIQNASLIDAETKLIQFSLKEGDLITAKVLCEQLTDSTHKTEFLNLINQAISELY